MTSVRLRQDRCEATSQTQNNLTLGGRFVRGFCHVWQHLLAVQRAEVDRITDPVSPVISIEAIFVKIDQGQQETESGANYAL